MRTITLLLCIACTALVACSVSGGNSTAPVTSGTEIQISATNAISIDPAVVASQSDLKTAHDLAAAAVVKPAGCSAGQILSANAGGGFDCTSGSFAPTSLSATVAALSATSTAQGQQLASLSATYLGKGDQAVDSAKLGNTPAASFQTTAQANAAYLGKTAQAVDAAELGSVAAANYVQHDASGNLVLPAGGRTVIAVGSNSTSIEGVWCGVSSATTGHIHNPVTGADGYRAAKEICQGVCSSPLAHMCRGTEMVRSVELAAFL